LERAVLRNGAVMPRSGSASRGRLRNVALAFPMGLAHQQPMIGGITGYARGRWTLTASPEIGTLSLERLRGWPGDGAIAAVLTATDRAAAAALRIPIITFAGALADPGVPRVTNDNDAVGRLVAAHLVERGFARFGCYGLRGVHYARRRERGFVAALAERGASVDVHRARNTLGARRLWPYDTRDLEAWIRSLRPPVGIFATNDLRARMVVDACVRLGLNVPHEVGVIGCDDDRVTCEFGVPALSSVRCDWAEIGRQLAMGLDRLMSGRRLAAGEGLVAPVGVVGRASTDTLVVDDPAVAAAVRLVRATPSARLSVGDLLRATLVSRRSLELAFRRALDCTPRQFLVGERLRRAKAMLADPARRSLEDIALACGFADARRFRAAFLKAEGVRPSQFRRASRDAIR
jgi:LacI family transcriptional regulator